MDNTALSELALPLNAHVYTSSGSCGECVCVILNPTTDQVTDVVVALKKTTGRQVMVPLDRISEVTKDSIQLDMPCEGMGALPEFRRTDYYEVELPVEFAGGPFVMWPYVLPERHEMAIETDILPANKLAIHRGAEVVSTEGPVGKVDEFMLDPASEHITHLVMREGHLWGARDVIIPVSAIARMDDVTVELRLDKAAIEALPEIRVDRNFHWKRAQK